MSNPEEGDYTKQIHIVGGGTFEPVRSHLALSAPAFGSTARQLGALCEEIMPTMDTNIHLTRMADPESRLETSDDLRALAEEFLGDYSTRMVFWAPAITDFRGQIGEIAPHKRGEKLDSAMPHTMDLIPNPKIIPAFRRDGIGAQPARKDIFTVGFKTTVDADPDTQYTIGLKSLKRNSLNLVLANDIKTGLAMVITPEEAAYHETTNRDVALRGLAEIAHERSQMNFTRSTVIAGESINWRSDEVFPALRAVVDHCIQAGAYQPVDGKTAGHFAAKIGPTTFLTSMRKTNFNDLDRVGLVKVETDGEDSVIAYGSKPSVGGQSQRIVFEQNPGSDCIVHFHCELKEGSTINRVSQREYECGSHQCGENTSNGLTEHADGKIKAVFLEQHGPNIVFAHDIDPQVVIDFIDENFDLTKKTGGHVLVG